jgi:hypothetical protein
LRDVPFNLDEKLAIIHTSKIRNRPLQVLTFTSLPNYYMKMDWYFVKYKICVVQD